MLLATIDEGASPHYIALKPRITLEAPRAFLSSPNQYLCGTARPSTSHVVHDVQIANASGKMVTVMALIDCGATSIFISPKLVRSLGLETSPAYITTLGLGGAILARARDSRCMRTTMRYFPHLAPVDESDVLVVNMTAYDLVLGLPWFQRHGPEIDWARKRLLSLRKAAASHSIGGLIATSPDQCDSGTTAESHVTDGTRSVKAEALISIEMLSATSFEKLLAGPEVSTTFAVRLWQGQGLLGGTVQGLNLQVTGETPHVAFTGAGVVGIAAAEAGACMRYAVACE